MLNKTNTGMEYKHVPESIGTGYVAQVEVLHQLHCVVSTSSSLALDKF